MSQNQSVGGFGERLAAMTMVRNGYRIVGQQVRTPFGEIDIIAEQGNALVFVEVKTRTSLAFGAPEEAITPEKQLHLRRSIEWYQQQHPKKYTEIRVDAFAVFLDQTAKKAQIKHIPNILS